jgi:hypothetical protein
MTTYATLGDDGLVVPTPAFDVPAPAKGDLELFSVTTIIDVLDKSGLKYWSAELTAEAAIDSEQTWKAMLLERGRAEAVKWLRDAMNRIPRNKLSSSDLGTVTHKACQEYAITGVRPSQDRIEDLVRSHGNATTDVVSEAAVVGRMLDRFDEWLQDFTPKMIAAEVAVYSPTYGYAGQMDAVMDIDGVRFITDYKSSRESWDKRGDPRGPYPDSVGLQLAGYRYAEFAVPIRPRRYTKWYRRYYLLSADEIDKSVPVPEVDSALCIYLTPEHLEAYPERADEEAHRAFLFCIEMFRWVNITSKGIQGEPLTR